MGYQMKRIYLLAACVLAVPVTHAEDNGALAEIVVTAQRRVENLQKVPISITAFNADELAKQNIKNATEYLGETPNVAFTEDKQSGSRGLAVSIRGINNLVSGENATINSTGIYLDEFSIASVPNGVANPFLPDMERIEVLRGPQGTYFGRNSLGGAINLTSRTPTDKYEGQITVGGEHYETNSQSENVSLTYNAPFSDTFKMRGVAYYEHSDGLVRNIGPGNGSGHNWINVRLKGLWTPSSATRVNFNLIYSKEKQGADESVPSGVNDLDTIDTFGYQPGTAFDPGRGTWATGNYKYYSADLQQQNNLRTVIGIVNVAHDFSSELTWKNIAGIIDSKQFRFFDNDLIGNLDLLSRTNDYSGKSYSIESRLEWRTSALDLTGGVLFAKDKQHQDNDVAVASNPTATLVRDGTTFGFLPPFPAGLGLALNTKEFKDTSAAAFADATWRATSQVEVFGGFRFTHDKVSKFEQQDGIRPDGTGLPSFFGSFINFPRPEALGEGSYNDFTPRIGVRFNPTEDLNFYAIISKGYKAGGFSTGNNTNAPGTPAIALPFNKEQLWNYEVGMKSEFLDHRVRLNVSVFYMKWKDIQFEAFRFLTPGDLSSNFEQTINLPKAESRGAEFELTARATERWTLGGSLGLLDTTILEDQACTVSALDPECVGGSKPTTITGGFKVFLKGKPIPNSPHSTLNLFSEYRFPVLSNSAWVRAEFQHRDSIYTDVEALANQQTLGPSPNQGLTRALPYGEFPYKVPAYNVIGFRAGFDMERASVNFYVKNLTDEHYYTGTYQKFGLSGIRLRPNPRTIGVNVTVKF